MRNKLFSALLVIVAAIAPAGAQQYSYQPPVKVFSSFSPSRPMASWRCAPSQLTAGSHLLDFLDTNSIVKGYFDCNGLLHGAGIVTPGGTNAVQGSSADGLFLLAIPNFTFNPITGDLALGARLNMTQPFKGPSVQTTQNIAADSNSKALVKGSPVQILTISIATTDTAHSVRLLYQQEAINAASAVQLHTGAVWLMAIN